MFGEETVPNKNDDSSSGSSSDSDSEEDTPVSSQPAASAPASAPEPTAEAAAEPAPAASGDSHGKGARYEAEVQETAAGGGGDGGADAGAASLKEDTDMEAAPTTAAGDDSGAAAEPAAAAAEGAGGVEDGDAAAPPAAPSREMLAARNGDQQEKAADSGDDDSSDDSGDDAGGGSGGSGKAPRLEEVKSPRPSLVDTSVMPFWGEQDAKALGSNYVGEGDKINFYWGKGQGWLRGTVIRKAPRGKAEQALMGAVRLAWLVRFEDNEDMLCALSAATQGQTEGVHHWYTMEKGKVAATNAPVDPSDPAVQLGDGPELRCFNKTGGIGMLCVKGLRVSIHEKDGKRVGYGTIASRNENVPENVNVTVEPPGFFTQGIDFGPEGEVGGVECVR